MRGYNTMTKKYIYPLFLMLISIASTATSSPIVICSHGIVDCFKQAFWYAKQYTFEDILYTNERYLFSDFATFNYPDAYDKIYNNPLWFTETSLGQDNEIARLSGVYKKVLMHTKDIILFGLSRGASTVLNFVGSHAPSSVKAIVIESPFDSAATIIDQIMLKSGLSGMPHSWGEYATERIFRKYSRDGINPCHVLCNISHDIPILIICSREDSLVPYTSSVKIYDMLRALGHQNVYILITDYGKHAKILSGIDGECYQAVTHAFFARYNLPHDAAIAEKGKSAFALCQP